MVRIIFRAGSKGRGATTTTDPAFATRRLMHEAVLKADQDPDRVSFLDAVCVFRRNPRDPRGVQRKMSNFPLSTRRVKALPPIEIRKALRILQ